MGLSHCKYGITDTIEDEISLAQQQLSNSSQDPIRVQTNSLVDFAENSGDELKWLNQCFTHLWPELDLALGAIVKGRILPKLRDLAKQKAKGKINDLSFSNFTLGKVPPTFGPIQVSGFPRGNVRVRTGMVYLSDIKMEMEVDAALVGKVRVGITNLQLKGQLVFRVRPYIHDTPDCGGVSVFFLNPPDIDFKLSGVAKMGNIPGLKGVIRYGLDKVLNNMMVLPNVATQLIGYQDMKLFPPVFSMTQPLGILRVKFVRAVIHSKAKVVPQANSATNHVSTKAQQQEADDKVSSSGCCGLTSKGNKAKTKAEAHAQAKAEHSHGLMEFVDSALGSLLGKNLDPYATLELGPQMWELEMSSVGETFDFTVFDPEQDLRVKYWDRDLLTEDDLLATTDKMDIRRMTDSSGMMIPLLHPEDRSIEIGQLQFQSAWYLATPSPTVNVSDDYLLVIKVRELNQQGLSLKGKFIALKAKLGSEEKMTNSGSYMKTFAEGDQSTRLLKDLEENMKREGLPQEAIKRILDLEDKFTVRIALNRSLHYSLRGKELENATLELSLIDTKQKGEDKNLKDNEVLGKIAIKISEVLKAPGLSLPGPFTFNGKAGEIKAQMHITLDGLKADDARNIPKNEQEVDDNGLQIVIEPS